MPIFTEQGEVVISYTGYYVPQENLHNISSESHIKNIKIEIITRKGRLRKSFEAKVEYNSFNGAVEK